MQAQQLPQSPPPPQSPYSQKILWTTLPAGFKVVNGQKQLRLHVHIAPRLQIAPVGQPNRATLQMFSDFAQWPENFGPKGLSFTVQFLNSQGGVVASVANVRPTAAPDAALWKYVAPPTMPVISYVADINPNQPVPQPVPLPTPQPTPFIHTFPSDQVYNKVRQVYTSMAIESPTRLPSVQRIFDANKGFGAIAMLPPKGSPKGPLTAAAQMRYTNAQKDHAQLLSQHGIIPANLDDPALAFHQLELYRQPRSALQPRDARPPSGGGGGPELIHMDEALAQLKQGMDFHMLTSFLGSYPALQRRLGLVLELVLPVPSNLPLHGSVQVLPQWHPATPTTPVTPATLYDLNPAATFLATPLISRMTNPADYLQRAGMLNLQNASYQLFEMDPAQSGVAVQNSLRNLLHQEGQDSQGSFAQDSGALPPLRSGGLAVHFVGRANWLFFKYQVMYGYEQSLQAGEPFRSALSADDVTRGYRVDVQDVTNGNNAPWRSLCQRSEDYTFANAPNGSALQSWQGVQDESFVQLATTRLPGFSDIFLGERMFRWLGWSLAAPRPGNTVDRDDTVTGPGFNPSDPSLNPYGIGVKVQPVAKSLPRLRFGRSYRMRARAVDLAGYSLALNEVTDPLAMSLVAGPAGYYRFEAIDAPLLALTAPLSIGETAAQLVIRSNYQQTAPQYSAAHPEFAPVCDRHIAPPVTTPDMAEMHGMFDNMRPPDSYSLIASRQGMPAVDGKNNMIDTGNPMKIPYLPDPLARGPAFFIDNIPASQPIPLDAKSIGPPNGAAPWTIDFYPGTAPDTPGPSLGRSWTQAMPLRLRIVDPVVAAKPLWDANARILSIPVPQGQTLTLRLSSYPTSSDLNKIMGLWNWVKSGAPGQTGTLEASALQGLQYMVTPYQELTLVHAVQQPLVIPSLQGLTLSRNFGDTVAWLVGQFPIDGNSTSKVEFMASWQEPSDDMTDLVNKMPKVVQGNAHACDFPPLPQASSIDLLGPDPKSNPSPAVERQQEFHDTKYRKVTYTAVARSRYQGHFPNNVGSFTQVSAPQTVEALSTARPAAPKVLYVIPSFSWQPVTAGSTVTRTRITGLRVYLERPWFSSGDGECLGVVLWPSGCSTPPPPPPLPPVPPPKGGGGQNPGTQGNGNSHSAQRRITRLIPSASRIQTMTVGSQNSGGGGKPTPVQVAVNVPPLLEKYVTQWGLDPLWLSNPVSDVPGMGDFKNAAVSGTCLTIDELRGLDATGQTTSWDHYDDALRVNAVGFPVSYDQERQLWFCDIAIDPQASYFPFIRLALARFQPNSVNGRYQYFDPNTGLFPTSDEFDVCLSHVVQADFAQIAPNRTLSIAPSGSAALNVTLAGITYSASAETMFAAARGMTEIVVSLETQPNGATDDAGWTPVPNSQQLLKLQRNPPNAVWHGVVNLPAARGSQPYRLVIKEYEKLMSDNLDVPVGRLVYADAVRL